jgi:hypothetical protein
MFPSQVRRYSCSILSQTSEGPAATATASRTKRRKRWRKRKRIRADGEESVPKQKAPFGGIGAMARTPDDRYREPKLLCMIAVQVLLLLITNPTQHHSTDGRCLDTADKSQSLSRNGARQP